jgi:hypothetical protein
VPGWPWRCSGEGEGQKAMTLATGLRRPNASTTNSFYRSVVTRGPARGKRVAREHAPGHIRTRGQVISVRDRGLPPGTCVCSLPMLA